MNCGVCMGTKQVRRNIFSNVLLPWLPKRLRDIDPNDEYHRDEECPKCKTK